MRYLAMLALILFAITARGDGSARVLGPVEQYNITSYPIFGKTITPDDSAALSIPGTVRADSAGAVTVLCEGNVGDNQKITLNLIAGEYVPCRVQKVYDTGTDNIVLHLFY